MAVDKKALLRELTVRIDEEVSGFPSAKSQSEQLDGFIVGIVNVANALFSQKDAEIHDIGSALLEFKDFYKSNSAVYANLQKRLYG